MVQPYLSGVTNVHANLIHDLFDLSTPSDSSIGSAACTAYAKSTALLNPSQKLPLTTGDISGPHLTLHSGVHLTTTPNVRHLYRFSGLFLNIHARYQRTDVYGTDRQTDRQTTTELTGKSRLLTL